MTLQNQFMKMALKEADSALIANEVPVGAAIVLEGKIIASAHNMNISLCDPTAHAEIITIRNAAKALGLHRLEGCDLYVTLEPCPMCAQAISFARIRRLYFGASDFKGGAVENGPKLYSQNTCFHCPEVFGGIMSDECSEILKSFFRAKRSA
jgi:tRNA(Arg) A34 adenosine deaminase TadA